MLIALNDIGQDDLFDTCIVGTGPAGITCARKLAAAGQRVLLLEGGGFDYDDASQNLYAGQITGDRYEDLDVNRLRFFGGTSNHWAGWCRPLDPWDFEPNAVDDKGWPISHADVAPYLAEASDILDLTPPRDPRPYHDSGLDEVKFEWSGPTRFNPKYRDELTAHPRIFLALNANVFQVAGNGRSVTHLVCRDYNGNDHTVRAQRYVIAAGGIETARLLMWSNELANGSLVASPELGHYHMDHPDYLLGDALMPTHLDGYDEERNLLVLAMSRASLKEHGTLGCSMRLQRKRFRESKRLVQKLICVAPEVGRTMAGLFDQKLVCGYQLAGIWEQEADRANRIELMSERDALGMPRINLHWRKTEFDKKSARVAAEVLGDYARRARLGRVRLWPYMREGVEMPPDVFCAHHMGMTRMGRNAADGVVDADCRVFGTDNLYVASSAIFRSGGWVNPTLSIVQFALRLGDHLARTS